MFQKTPQRYGIFRKCKPATLYFLLTAQKSVFYQVLRPLSSVPVTATLLKTKTSQPKTLHMEKNSYLCIAELCNFCMQIQ